MHMRKHGKYYVVIPAYNEAKNIGDVLRQIVRTSIGVIVVDDGSRDDTAYQATKICPIVLTHPINLGKGAAMKTGCEYAFNILHADGVIFMDSDGQHHPHEISKFVAELDKSHDLVFGVRTFNRRMPKSRQLANKALSRIIALTFGAYIPDILSGFKAVSRNGYAKIIWDAQGYDVETEIAAHTAAHKLDFVTIPISTIYNSLDRGMTATDALAILPKLIEWRLRL